MVVTPFGPARELAPPSPRAPRPVADSSDHFRSAFASVRAAVAVVLVLAAPLSGATTDDIVRFGLLIGVAWIPAAGLAAAVGRRRPSVVADLVGFALDIVLLVVVEVVLRPSPAVALVGVLAVVVGATYLRGRAAGLATGVVGTTALAVSSQTFTDAVGSYGLLVYPAFVLLAAWMVDAVAVERWRARSDVEHLHGKSDAILTGVGEAVVVTTPTGNVEQWNRAATSTFGCASDEARGRRCSDALGLVHGVRELDCSKGCALLTLESAGPAAEARAADVEVWRRSPTGTRQPLLASASPVLDAEGEVVEVVHSFRDITRLKQADEAKTLFLATASHELKTPLTVIRGFAQMLLMSESQLKDDEREAALRAIDMRAGQLTAIVDRLLMSSRIEAGRIELSPVDVDVRAILRERVEALEGATGRRLALVLDDDLPTLRCDADAFTTVVDHLLDNAVKYSPGGDVVTVAATTHRDTVELRVTDKGVGMTAEQAEHCFDRFYQAEATDLRRFGGTGIGLYIVRSLVEGMGGTIEVSSAPGRGSTFRVELARADRSGSRPAGDERGGRGEPTMIREYMRQLGVPVGREQAAPARSGR